MACRPETRRRVAACCAAPPRSRNCALPQCSITARIVGFRCRIAKPRPRRRYRHRAGSQPSQARSAWNRAPKVNGICHRHARVCTTRRTSTTPAAWASSPTSRARRATRSSRRGSRSSKNLTHRGATGADPLQGDGAGILIQMPDAFLREACGRQGVTLPAGGRYGVGMVFLPKEPASRMACEQEIERAIARRGPDAARLARRARPTTAACRRAREEVEPVIRQVFVAGGATTSTRTRSSASSTSSARSPATPSRR